MAIAGAINGANLTLTDSGYGYIEENNYLANLVISKFYINTISGERLLTLIFGGQPIFYLPSSPTAQGYGNTLFGSADPMVAKTAAQTQLGGSSSSGSSTVMPKIGDLKHSYFAIDHDGWVKLAGQPKSSLPATQQANATALGFAFSLINAADLAFVGTSGTKATGSTGGSASATIAQGNIPAYLLSGGGHSHGISDPGHNHTSAVGASGQKLGDVNGTGISSQSFQVALSPGGNALRTDTVLTGVSVQSSGLLSIASGGSGTALPIQNPYLAANTFIYLGI